LTQPPAASVETITADLHWAAEGARTRLDLWTRIVQRTRPAKVLEIGVWKGEFAAHILVHCDSIAEYAMLDSWRNLAGWDKPWNVPDETFEDIYREALSKTAFAAERRKIHRGTTTEVIGEIADESQDLVYIDGDHTLRGIVIDLVNALPKVKRGGFLAGDDFVPSLWRHGGKYEPTLVFPTAAYFAEAVGATFFALPFDQFLMVRPAGKPVWSFVDLTGRNLVLSLKRQLGVGRAIANLFGLK